METITTTIETTTFDYQNNNGMFGAYGGAYVPPVLEEKLQQLGARVSRENS